MPSRRLSVTARRFLTEEVHSVLQLELLLLLARDGARAWIPAAAAAELRGPEAWVEAQMADLAARGVLLADAHSNIALAYRFAVTGPWGAVVNEIAELYPARRTTIIKLIFSTGSDVRSFSDAFRLRPEEDA
jgi:hypothetical protein